MQGQQRQTHDPTDASDDDRGNKNKRKSDSVANQSKTSKPPFSHVDRLQLYTIPPSPLILLYNAAANRLDLSSIDEPTTASHIIAASSNAILSFFQTVRTNSDRLIYIATALIFESSSPLPYGGRKNKPGYIEFEGTTVASLLEYIVSAAFKRYWAFRGRQAVDFVVESLNKAMRLHLEQDRDLLNELTLRGIGKAGHHRRRNRNAVPKGLEHVDENWIERVGVEFTPARTALKNL
ncbi:hypothetical protein BJ741DRAFT_198772 [Chytriomyces cf. hyalinus JEL632]|nr:hypothetical protein BJ741DRAFT_198772 [Chytriomyces cf. hyalinus JEL632]